MKILRLIYDWPPPWLGLAAAPYELSRAQVLRGHTVDVFSGRWSRQGEPTQDEGITQHFFLGNKFLPFRSPLKGLMLVTVSVLLFFRYKWWRRKNTPDIIHSHGSFGLWISVYRNFLKKIAPNRSKELKIPMVAHFHNTVEGRRRKLIDQGVKIKFVSKYIDYPLATWSDKLQVKNADALIFVGKENMQDAISLYGADPQKCFLVETGVNTQIFKHVIREEKNKILVDMGLEPGDKVILFVGLLSERKGIHHLIEMMKHLPFYYKLLLVGDYDPVDKEYKNRITDLLNVTRVDNRVFFAGYIPYPQTPIAYQSADIFVLPSSFEGTPKVVMESLSTGVPVLASGFKLDTQISGLEYLQNTDPQYIAQKVQEMISSGVKVDVDAIQDQYSWDVKAKLLDQIYNKILQQRNNPINENSK